MARCTKVGEHCRGIMIHLDEDVCSLRFDSDTAGVYRGVFGNDGIADRHLDFTLNPLGWYNSSRGGGSLATVSLGSMFDEAVKSLRPVLPCPVLTRTDPLPSELSSALMAILQTFVTQQEQAIYWLQLVLLTPGCKSI
jgi:hypothetical protein